MVLVAMASCIKNGIFSDFLLVCDAKKEPAFENIVFVVLGINGELDEMTLLDADLGQLGQVNGETGVNIII